MRFDRHCRYRCPVLQPDHKSAKILVLVLQGGIQGPTRKYGPTENPQHKHSQKEHRQDTQVHLVPHPVVQSFPHSFHAKYIGCQHQRLTTGFKEVKDSDALSTRGEKSMPKRKLLLINKFYHDKGRAGGVGRYLVQEEEDLTAAGSRSAIPPRTRADGL